MGDDKEKVYITREELERIKNAEIVEITREELEKLKEKAGPEFSYGDTWPGSQHTGGQ